VRAFDLGRLTDAPLGVSRIGCECKVWKVRKNHRTGGLVTFRGAYRPGSAGTDDARFIRWKLGEFYELYTVDGLVVDCRELDYTWGDDLDFSGRQPNRADDFPLLVVLRPEQQEAYAYAVAREKHRHDLLGALAEVDEAIRIMKSLL
jgi:hypothetical protein